MADNAGHEQWTDTLDWGLAVGDAAVEGHNLLVPSTVCTPFRVQSVTLLDLLGDSQLDLSSRLLQADCIDADRPASPRLLSVSCLSGPLSLPLPHFGQLPRSALHQQLGSGDGRAARAPAGSLRPCEVHLTSK